MITVFASASARALVLRHPRSALARLSLQRVRQASMQHVAMGEADRPASMVAVGQTTSLNGTVRRVLFRADSGYTVATLDCSPQGRKAVVITSNHCLALVQPGERLAVVGRWTEHHKFGTQLQVESTSGLETGATPSTAEGMEELLCSRAIKGVGPKLAATLVQEFGESTLDVLLSEEREEELLRVPGMGAKTLERVRTSAREWADSRDALGFGLSLGLSGAQAYALVKKHGANSEAKVAAYPPHSPPLPTPYSLLPRLHYSRPTRCVPTRTCSRISSASPRSMPSRWHASTSRPPRRCARRRWSWLGLRLGLG